MKILLKIIIALPIQINKLQESDSELLNINILENDQLAVTTDSIVEEIEMGIYKDPYLIGWMTVMVNMSDLAAVAQHRLVF